MQDVNRSAWDVGHDDPIEACPRLVFVAVAKDVAGPRGVSSFLNEAARERLARLELRGLLDELDAKHGAAPAAVRAENARDARRIFRAR
jgi:hypothetical protein